MPLNKDLSNLPVATSHAEPPSSSPVFAPLLAQAWADAYEDTEPPIAEPGARIRHSWAGMCSRSIAYRLDETEPSNPITLADHHRFNLGKVIHSAWQQALADAFDDYEMEKTLVLEDGLLAGHADAVGPAPKDPDQTVCLELKTINGFGFKRLIGDRGLADGPRWSAKLQGALNAKAAGADWLVLVYISLECMSVQRAKKGNFNDIERFCAEWRYPREVWEVWADGEAERMANIVAAFDAGVSVPRFIPDPEIPPGATITDPSKGLWTVSDAFNTISDAGSTWHCNYCGFQDRCMKDLIAERKTM